MNEFSERTVTKRRYPLALLIAGGLLLLFYGLLVWPFAASPARAQEARTTEQAAIEVRQTVGETEGNCAATTVIAAPAGRTVYYCVTIRNNGDVPLSQHTIAVGTIRSTFSSTIPPGKEEEMNVTSSVLSGLGAPNSNILLRKLANTDSPIFTNTVTVTSTNAAVGAVATGKASARVVLGTAAVRVTKTVALNDDCSGTRALAVPISTTVKYCVIIQNIGTLPLANHRLVDPLLKIDVNVASGVPVNTSVRITDANLRRIDSTQHLELLITGDITNSLTVTSTTADGAAVAASNQAVAVIGRTSMSATATLGLEDQCSTTTALTSLNGRTVYHCLRLTNNGTIPLEIHNIQWSQSTSTTPVNATITETVQPGQTLIITRSRITQFAQANVAAATNTNVTTNNFIVTSTHRRGFATRVQAQSQLTVNTQGVTLTKRPSLVSGSNCDPNISLSVGSTQDFYYCLIIVNNGAVPLVSHTIKEGAPLNISASFTYTLNAGQRLTLTNETIASTLKIPAFLGPFRANANFPSTTTITSLSAANIAVTANAPLQVVVSTATPTLTPLPTQAPTLTPFPTVTPTPSFTPLPTPTPSPVVLSFMPTPVPPFDINAVATPTPGLLLPTVDPFATPTIDPFATPTFDPFAPTSPVATPDLFATSVAATVEVAATQTMIAMLQPPVTDTPMAPQVESPLATPIITTTVILTPTPVILVLTPIPTPVPPTGYLDVMAQVFQVSTATLGWLWFVLGSVIFFATAGMFAGLTWRSRGRRGLYEVDENADQADETMELETDITQPLPAQPLPTQPSATRPPANHPPTNRSRTSPAANDENADNDDYWPPSLR